MKRLNDNETAQLEATILECIETAGSNILDLETITVEMVYNYGVGRRVGLDLYSQTVQKNLVRKSLNVLIEKSIVVALDTDDRKNKAYRLA
jgi:hypothetical protein